MWNREPWHGQSNVLASVLNATEHPRCEQFWAKTSTLPPALTTKPPNARSPGALSPPPSAMTKAAFGLVGVRMRVAELSSSWSSGVSSAIARGFFFWPDGGAGHRKTRIGRPPATTVAVRRLASHQPRKVRREYRLSAEASAIRLKC